jgi:hypothetical protein
MDTALKTFFSVYISKLLLLFVAINLCCTNKDSGCNGIKNVEDKGRLIRYEKELRPLYMPFKIVVSREMLHDNIVVVGNQRRIKLEILHEAIQWWHEKTGRRDLFSIEIIDSYRTNMHGDISPPHGQVYIRVEDATHIGSEDISDRGGIITLGFNKTTGMIYSAIMSINAVMLNNDLHQRNVLLHELGHVLGLSDDINVPSNKSVMRSKLVLDDSIILTKKDRILVLEL